MSPIVKPCKLYSHDRPALAPSLDPPPSSVSLLFSPTDLNYPEKRSSFSSPHSVSAPSHLACARARFLIKRHEWQSTLSKLRLAAILYYSWNMDSISGSRQPVIFPGRANIRADDAIFLQMYMCAPEWMDVSSP